MDFLELGLDERLLHAIQDMGFTKPTNVQQSVIPEALDGHDVLADSPTGTGKTAAYLLPCLQHLIDFPAKKLGLSRILVLVPTRELALQVTEQAKALGKYLQNLTMGCLIGGVDHEDQLPVITEKTDLVVATPGRLLEYLRKKSFDIRAVEVLVLDEADRMLDMGFIDDVKLISKAASRREQTFLFSATLEGELLTAFANNVLKDPVELHVDAPRSEHRKIHQYNYFADDLEHKIKLLEYMLRDATFEKCLVFVKTRERLQELSSRLTRDGFEFSYIRGEMEQEKRIQALSKFASGGVKILIATDVAARGIDIPDITHVINFDLPRSADIYVHRIGRTARAGKKGTAINLVEAHDMPMLEKAQRYTGDKQDVRVIDSLRPQHKIAEFSAPKKKKKDDTNSFKDKDDEKKQHRKDRLRDKKNKGKPDFAGKRARKEAQAEAPKNEAPVKEKTVQVKLEKPVTKVAEKPQKKHERKPPKTPLKNFEHARKALKKNKKDSAEKSES